MSILMKEHEERIMKAIFPDGLPEVQKWFENALDHLEKDREKHEDDEDEGKVDRPFPVGPAESRLQSGYFPE